MTETQHEYPTTARRAFVNLAEAVRTVNDGSGLRNLLTAIAGLHMDETYRYILLTTVLDKIPLGWGHSTDWRPEVTINRENVALALANLLDGREKFHAGRFIHHAISDSTADDDGEGGKWSYNRMHPEDAQKTTIESIGDDGEATETITVL